MNDYRSVVVHVSDSERSDALLSCAAMLAAAQGASLRAVHAVKPLYLGVGLTPESDMTAAQFGQETERARTTRAQDRVLDVSRAIGTGIEFVSPAGDPVEAMSARLQVADLALRDALPMLQRAAAVEVLSLFMCDSAGVTNRLGRGRRLATADRYEPGRGTGRCRGCPG